MSLKYGIELAPARPTVRVMGGFTFSNVNVYETLWVNRNKNLSEAPFGGVTLRCVLGQIGSSTTELASAYCNRNQNGKSLKFQTDISQREVKSMRR